MATAPQYAATPAVASAAVGAAAEASYTAPTTAVTVVTAGANGTKIDEIVYAGLGSTLAGVILVFLYDGASYRLYDMITVPVWAASATVAPWRYVKQYDKLTLPSGWSLRVASMVASQLVQVTACGGNF